MATDASETPSHLPSHLSQQRHFYLAVDRLRFKMETLVDLLGVVGRRHSLPMVVCCSSRDELDAVCSAVANLPYISLAPLYSDLAEAERASVLEKFRQATVKWNQNVSVQSVDDSEIGKDEQKSHMIVATDVCLPLATYGESPISAHILINYELPTKKETYMRRVATCLAAGCFTYCITFVVVRWYRHLHSHNNFIVISADGIVINMVVGGEVVTLKNIEESSNLVIAEMPINISETL